MRTSIWIDGAVHARPTAASPNVAPKYETQNQTSPLPIKMHAETVTVREKSGPADTRTTAIPEWEVTLFRLQHLRIYGSFCRTQTIPIILGFWVPPSWSTGLCSASPSMRSRAFLQPSYFRDVTPSGCLLDNGERDFALLKTGSCAVPAHASTELWTHAQG